MAMMHTELSRVNCQWVSVVKKKIIFVLESPVYRLHKDQTTAPAQMQQPEIASEIHRLGLVLSRHHS